MSEGKRFFCFPIGMLAYYPADPINAMDKMLDWALNYLATRSYDGWDRAQLKELLEEKGIGSTGGKKPSSAAECRLALAAKSLNVTLGHLGAVEDGVRSADRFLIALSRPAQNNLVQICTDWFWDCMYTEQGKPVDRSLSWREFRILSALLSKVGAQGYKKCGWQEIQARALGCCGKTDYRCLSNEAKEARASLALTRGQIRTTLDRLESDLFFARYNHGWSGKARESWFSFSMSREDLRGKVLGTKERRREQLESFRDADKEAAAKKRPADSQPVANINTEKPETSDAVANINRTGNNDQGLANLSANQVANAVANINKNNSNRNNLNPNDSNEEQRIMTPLSF